jgi:hypothetical protein
MIFRSEFLCLCRVEYDRRRTAKLIHPSSNGRSFGRTYILKTLSGQMGVTTLDDGKTQSFGPFRLTGIFWTSKGFRTIARLEKTRLTG